VKLRLLGPFEARLGAGLPLAFSTRRSQALLAYLALRPGRAHSRERIAALLWDQVPEARARQNLRQALSELRRVLKGSSALTITRDAVALRQEHVDADVTAFARLLAEKGADALERALALYRGELLEGLELEEPAFEEWLRAERERLRALAAEGFAKLLDRRLQADAHDEALRVAKQLAELEPFHEPAHRALMRLYCRLGSRAAALRQYQVCVQVLRRELGAEPEEETRRLYEEIVAQQPARGAPAAVATRGVPAHAAAHDTQLVGREAEMAALEGALARAWRGAGGTSFILGEAGVGKTRLVEELAGRAAARGAWVFVGRSFELEQILPFRPWIEAFREGQLAADALELAELSPASRVALGRLLSGSEGANESDEAQDRARLYEAVAQVLSHLARRRPLLVILEDLHWADESSLRMLAFLHRRIALARVLLVGTARDEEFETTSVLGRLVRATGDETEASRIALPPLSRSEIEALVRALVPAGRAPEAVATLAARIWSLSEGNAFVAVEATRARGAALAAPELPARMRELIAERLERLDEDARELVAVAAVIGREIDYPVLRQTTAADAAGTARALEKLVRRRVLQSVGERFAFTHERIREVAYAQLLAPRRRLLHERVALAMENVYAEDLGRHAAALGAHFEEAGSWEKAAVYLRRAGIQAHERSASREAAACFERALRSLERLPRGSILPDLAIDLRLDLQSSLLLLGDLPHIVEHLRVARSLAEPLGDRLRLGRVLAHSTNCGWWLGDCDAALESGTAAAAIADEIGDVALQVIASCRLGQVHLSLAEYERAQALFGRVIELLADGREGERFGMPSLPAVVAHAFLNWVLVLRGEFDAARAAAAEGVRVAETVRHTYSLAVAYRGLALAPLAQGDLPSAIPPLERALELCRSCEFPFMAPWVTGELGRAYALAGRAGDAVPLLEQTVEDSGRLQMMMIHPRDLTALAEAYALAGRAADALRTIERGLHFARIHKQRGVEAEALRVLGDAATLVGEEAERGGTAYRDALALASELGMRPLAATCQLRISASGAARGVTPARARSGPGSKRSSAAW
jgi:DNA-binding SARP family transcriptional activator